jgi:hypothetical protein
VSDDAPNTALGAVRWLCATSTADGADVDRAAKLLVAVLLDLAAYRRGDFDPRRQRTLQLAERVRRAKDAGVPVVELGERFGKSRSQVYRLLSRTTSRDSFAVSSPTATQRRRRSKC